MASDATGAVERAAPPHAVWIIYTNWKDETERRYIRPGSVFYGSSPWHREPQWLLEAWDVERRKHRTFALSGIHGWAETSGAFDALLATAARAIALATENAQLRATLEWYGDPARYTYRPSPQGRPWLLKPEASEDAGQRARDALAPDGPDTGRQPFRPV